METLPRKRIFPASHKRARGTRLSLVTSTQLAKRDAQIWALTARHLRRPLWAAAPPASGYERGRSLKNKVMVRQ